MNIKNPIISGAVRSIKSIKGVLAIWLSTLIPCEPGGVTNEKQRQ